MEKKYTVFSFYLFEPLEDFQEEIERQKAFCQENEILGRLYVSEQGVNGQMSALNENAEKYKEWIRNRDPFKNLTFRAQKYHEHAFPKCTIKYRKQLAALDKDVSLQNKGDYLNPKEWREKLESDDEHILLDVRNDYEWKVGHFEGSELPACSTFREFQEYATELKKRLAGKDTPIMMCCTGGIRCELFSSLLKEEGLKNIYQLQGGIINYGANEGSKHWRGKLFVFDDRLTVPISDEKAEVIGKCHSCGGPAENYYNCANMDCNELFLACDSCLKKLVGCCQTSCQEAPRVRPVSDQEPHKPFRKWYHYPDVPK